MKTTKKHYEYFKERCRYYQKELGLMGWEIHILHRDISDFAEITANSDNKAAEVVLALNWNNNCDIKPSEEELDATAFHEILHLRLQDLAWVGKSRYMTLAEIDRAMEESVTALENFYRNHQ